MNYNKDCTSIDREFVLRIKNQSGLSNKDLSEVLGLSEFTLENFLSKKTFENHIDIEPLLSRYDLHDEYFLFFAYNTIKEVTFYPKQVNQNFTH